MRSDCIFCKIAAGQMPARILYQDEQIVAFHDIHPVAPTHILLIPRRHIENVASAEAADATLLGKMVLAAARIAETEGLNSGFRLVTNSGVQAGQGIFHLHLHLLGGRRMSWPPG